MSSDSTGRPTKIYDEEDYTVYKFYIGDHLYAWTTSKDDRNEFASVRGKIFYMKKQVMDPVLYHAFMVKYKDQQLIEVPLQARGEYLTVIGTYAEDTRVEMECDKLLDIFGEMDLYFGKFFEREISDSADELLEDIKHRGTFEEAVSKLMQYVDYEFKETDSFKVDTIALFYDLFKNTF